MHYLQTRHPSIAEWSSELADPLAGVFGGRGRVGGMIRLVPPQEVADDTMKLLVFNRRGRPLGVLLCSSPLAPDMVAMNMERARQAEQALGAELGRVVLSPLLEGRASGLSYALLPYCPPLSGSRLVGKIQRRWIAPSLFDWLRRATEATASPPPGDGADPEIAAALEQLAEDRAMTGRVRSAAARALGRLANGAWAPCRVLMHNDLWLGNVLRRRDPDAARGPRPRRFAIIDWAGSRLDGFPFYDLVRLAMSVGQTPRWLGAEVPAHCRILGCDPSDAMSYLAAALGDIGLNLGHFPAERYATMADSCMTALERTTA